MKNNLAGIGDPYWYEWSVGLYYLVDILKPDTQIKSVTFQSSDSQCLDDVVIEYENGSLDCIQVKHTREDATLSVPSITKLLTKMASDWKKLSESECVCNPILFSNKKFQILTNVVKNPPVEPFWNCVSELCDNAKTMSDVVFTESNLTKGEQKRYEYGWSEWLSKVSHLSETEQLEFFKRFIILAGQPDLDELQSAIAQKLQEVFFVSKEVGEDLIVKLRGALINWTTTLRDSEVITKENVLRVLSIHSDKIQGVHNFPPTVPFFPSRVDFTSLLQQSLETREKPIVFLHGLPGSGKTNVVSYLANKRDTCITLRFHAFKPLNPHNLGLSADKGVSSPRDFWANLLIELREIFAGYHKLAEYNIPPTVALITETDVLRQKVLELSEVLWELTGKITVIAVDGIDHAARSGDSNTFLSTLIPPKEVPPHVCFLIAGQPITEYKEYPSFLHEEDGVLLCEVPPVDKSDILLLVKDWFDNSSLKKSGYSLNALVDKIQEISAGNTLATVFAVEELKASENIETFFIEVQKRKLDHGIEQYYQYIWEFTKENLKENHLDLFLIGVFSLLKKQVSADILHKIEPQVTVTGWESVLQNLFPLVIPSENSYYSLFHNDIRIFFQKKLNKSPQIIGRTSAQLADYLLSQTADIPLKHLQLFEFIKNARRETEFIDIFTIDYVLEAIEAKCPWEDMIDQLEDTLLSLPHALQEVDDYQKVLGLSCAVSTLSQLEQVLRYTDTEYPSEIPCPAVFPSEQRVIPFHSWTADLLTTVFDETSQLCTQNEVERAKENLVRWMLGITPDTLCNHLAGENFNVYLETEEEFDEDLEELCKEISQLFIYWGVISRRTEIFIDMSDVDVENTLIKFSYGFFTSGWLEEGGNHLSLEDIKTTLALCCIHKREDTENYFRKVLETNDNDAIEYVFNHLRTKGTTDKFIQLKLVLWAIKHGISEQCSGWLEEISRENIHFIPIDKLHYTDKLFPYQCKILYLLSFANKMTKNDYNKLRDEISESDSEQNPNIRHLLFLSFRLGDDLNALIRGEKLEFGDDFQNIVQWLLDGGGPWYENASKAFETQDFLLKELVYFSEKFPEQIETPLVTCFANHAIKTKKMIHFDVWWDFLKKKQKHRVLRNVFQRWMNPCGILWSWPIEDIFPQGEKFIVKARELDWETEVNKCEALLSAKTLGYVGHKDYSFLEFVKYYEIALQNYDIDWKITGLQLLNLSNFASNTGNNRGASSVDSVVAVSAALKGPTEFWQFARLNNSYDEYWLTVIFDGIMGAMEKIKLTQDELLSIWYAGIELFVLYEDWATKAFNIRGGNRKSTIYLTDLRDCLLAVESKYGYEVTSKMKEMALVQFDLSITDSDRQSYIIPERWFRDNSEKNTSQNHTFKTLKDCFYQTERWFSWRNLSQVVRDLLHEGENIDLYLNDIFDMLKSKSVHAWHSDGRHEMYKVMFKHFDKNDLSLALEEIATSYVKYSVLYRTRNLYSLKKDLDYFTQFFYESILPNKGFQAFEEVAKMHKKWVTANGRLEFKGEYTLPNIEELKDWTHFCDKLVNTRISESSIFFF